MLRNYNSLSEKRRRQIDTLKIFNDHVIEVKENLEYRVEFISGSNNMSLDVELGPEFPNEKPVLLVSPLIIHPWVEDNKIVAAPGLLNFTIHSDLGRVVHAIIREFEKNPPIFASGTKNLDGNSYIQSPSSHPSVQLDKSSALCLSPLPSIASGHISSTMSAQFPQLNDLTPQELQNILDNVDLQDDFLKTVPESADIDKTLDELRNTVEELATNNLSNLKLLENLKSSIADEILVAQELESLIEERNKTLDEMSEPYSVKKIKELLNNSAADADQDAESIVEEFMSGLIPADVFVIRYTEKRGLGQCRRAKYDRLAD